MKKIPFDIFQIVVRDITTIDADAIINPTDSSYSGAGGIDHAIHSAAGKDLMQALSSNMRIEAGQAIITPSFQIKTAKWIIHTVGPKWKTGFFFEEFKLAECYRRSLQLAIDHDCKSVAFPCISIGANQFPKERAAEIAIYTVANMLQAIDHVSCLKRVFFVCGSKIQSEIYKRQLKKAIIEYFIHNNSPESYESFFSIGEYYSYVEQLAVLEWGEMSHYKKYQCNFGSAEKNSLPAEYSRYDMYAQNMDSWDYNTCLAYLITLFRPGWIFYDTDLMPPQYIQSQNGTVRRVLLHMRTILE